MILAGNIGEEDGGREHERVIVQACTEDKWSNAVIVCIASDTDPIGCLDQLTEAQHVNYEQRIDRWAEKYDTGGDDGDDVDAGDTQLANCYEVIDQAALFEPVVDETAPDSDWLYAQRQAVLEHACEGWDQTMIACVADRESVPGVTGCLASLETAERDALEGKLKELDALAKRMAAARKKPKSLECKQVVAAHYGDAQWKKKLDGFKPADRKKMIAASRAKMLKACAAEAWPELTRACLVSLGGETCFEGTGARLSWGYPAAGTTVSLGIPECDAYKAALDRLIACDFLPQASREHLRDAFDQTQATVAAQPADQRKTAGPTCKAGSDAIEQALAGSGC